MPFEAKLTTEKNAQRKEEEQESKWSEIIWKTEKKYISINFIKLVECAMDIK